MANLLFFFIGNNASPFSPKDLKNIIHEQLLFRQETSVCCFSKDSQRDRGSERGHPSLFGKIASHQRWTQFWSSPSSPFLDNHLNPIHFSPLAETIHAYEIPVYWQSRTASYVPMYLFYLRKMNTP